MVNEIDEELERIKKQKQEELMKLFAGEAEKTTTPNKTIGKPLDLTDDTFTRFIKENHVAVIDCWAPWCGPCRFLSPVIEELARDYRGKIAFGKLNVDENQTVARQYGIMSIPTLLIFKGGKMVERIVGAMPRNMLEPKIKVHL